MNGQIERRTEGDKWTDRYNGQTDAMDRQMEWTDRYNGQTDDGQL